MLPAVAYTKPLGAPSCPARWAKESRRLFPSICGACPPVHLSPLPEYTSSQLGLLLPTNNCQTHFSKPLPPTPWLPATHRAKPPPQPSTPHTLAPTQPPRLPTNPTSPFLLISLSPLIFSSFFFKSTACSLKTIRKIQKRYQKNQFKSHNMETTI